MKIAGIDPSIHSSGKVIMDLDDENFDIRSVDFYGYQPVIKAAVDIPHLKITCSGTDYDHIPMSARFERAFTILDIDMEDVKYVSFEDYAYDEANQEGSNSIFQIGEFCGGARYHFYMQGKGIITYGIPQIKHFATGKGNAKKPAMCEAVREFFPDYYLPYFDTFPKQYESPHSDLCDAFWICEILRNHIKYSILGPESLPEDILALMTVRNKRGKKTSRALVDYSMYRREDYPVDLVALATPKTARKGTRTAKKA